jgi:antitoxin (DNA-binding transcriptional repressor) of toxin-antitoxin stability system
MATILGHVETSVKRVKIAELKNRLSHYLRRVQRGEAILVCDRDRVIARIERAGGPTDVSATDAEWLDRLERRGAIRRAVEPLPPDWMRHRLPVRGDVLGTLLRERDEGR